MTSLPRTMPQTEAQQRYLQGRLALESFYRMQPSLEAFARVFTGKSQIQVRPHAKLSFTDGKTIHVKVDIKLAERRHHERLLCDKRDVFGTPRCFACELEEDLFVTLFHEIAHNAYDSFEAMTPEQQRLAVVRAVREAQQHGVSDRRLEKIRQSFLANPPENYNEAAARISPYLPVILNALEDTRVDSRMMEARPGMKVMYAARTRKIFEEGFRADDGSIIGWREQPLNSQVIVGLHCLGSGYNFAGWFADEIEEALNDPELRELTLRVTEAERVEDAYELCYPVLQRLRELGFCLVEEDKNDEPGEAGETGEPQEGDEPGQPNEGGGESDSDEADDSDDDEGAAGGDGGEPDDSDDEADDDLENGDADDDEPGVEDEPDDEAGNAAGDGQADEGDVAADEDSDEPDHGDGSGSDDGDGDAETEAGADEDGSPASYGTPEEMQQAAQQFSGHEDEEEEDELTEEEQQLIEAIERAIQQAENFDSASFVVRGVRTVQPTERDSAYVRYPYAEYKPEPLNEGILQRSLSKVRVAFTVNHAAKEERNHRSGRVDARMIGRRVPTGDDRIFKRRRLPGKRNYFVLIGIDISYSTNSRDRLKNIKTAAMMQAELLDRLGVDFEVWAHTASDVKGGAEVEVDAPHGRGMHTELNLEMYPIKLVTESWNDAAKDKLERLTPRDVNLDGHTFEFYRKRLDMSRATDRILMYYTDGDMPYFNYSEELHLLKRELQVLRQHGHKVVGVGFQTDSPKAHGLPTVRVDTQEDIGRVVEALKKLLM